MQFLNHHLSNFYFVLILQKSDYLQIEIFPFLHDHRILQICLRFLMDLNLFLLCVHLPFAYAILAFHILHNVTMFFYIRILYYIFLCILQMSFHHLHYVFLCLVDLGIHPLNLLYFIFFLIFEAFLYFF